MMMMVMMVVVVVSPRAAPTPQWRHWLALWYNAKLKRISKADR